METLTSSTTNDSVDLNGPKYSDAQIMMTLAAIAYADQDNIAIELKDKSYATGGEWNLVWGPVSTIDYIPVDNLIYVVQYQSSSTYAVVIRGTVLDFDLSTLFDLYEDLDVDSPVAWSYPAVDGAYIAGGTSFGLEILTHMYWNGQYLLDFFRSLSDVSKIYVTGHSLGGCLTTVLAPWLKYNLNKFSLKPSILPYTFAAPTAGNAVFADWYTKTFGPESARYYNEIDLIPLAWGNLPGMESLFPGGPGCPRLVKDMISLINDYLPLAYAQPNGKGSPLPGTSSHSGSWFDEAGYQHDHNNYLRLLKAPPVKLPNVFTAKRDNCALIKSKLS